MKSDWKVGLLKNLPAGLLIGSIMTLAVTWLLSSEWTTGTERFWVYLATAITTLLAATIAVSGQLAALEQGRRLDEEQRLRRLSAAKILLPSALSDIIEACSNGITQSYNDRQQYRNSPITSRQVQIEFSDETLATLQSVVENAEVNDARFLASILRHHQIALSRWNGRNHRPNGFVGRADEPIEIARSMALWAYISSLAANSFNYGRGVSEIDRRISAEDILEPMLRIGLGDDWSPNAPITGWEKIVHRACRHYANRHLTGNWLS